MSVSRVDVTRPPITTIASGRWISEPGPLANSSGTRPIAAMLAVMSTGRSRRCAPRTTISAAARLALQLVEIRDHHDTVQHRDAEQRDEAHGRRHGQVLPRGQEREHAADERERYVRQHEQRLAQRSEHREQQHEHEPERDRHHQREPRGGPLLVLELPAPCRK